MYGCMAAPESENSALTIVHRLYGLENISERKIERFHESERRIITLDWEGWRII